jgi:3-deoxy-7-phosphoheptulonate synthase
MIHRTRSSPLVPSGDNVNGLDPDQRTPDPERLLAQVKPTSVLTCALTRHRAYFHSATTINHIRSLLGSGFASLSHPREWSLAHVRSPALKCAPRAPHRANVS